VNASADLYKCTADALARQDDLSMASTPPPDAAPTTPPDDNTIPPADDPGDAAHVLAPPTTFGGTLRQLGPGLIIAGSIVGSGELIATTKTGAQAGMTLLWLIAVGCVIKVFVQIELGRYAITYGKTTLAALNTVPGRIGPVNWILWFWLAMMSASIAQLGGIVGGVGQSLALAYPITGDYVAAIQVPAANQLDQYLDWDETLLSALDLRLVERPAAAYAVNDEFQSHIAAWDARKRTEAQQRLSQLAPGDRTKLQAAYREAFHDIEDLSAGEVEEKRAALRETLLRLNAAPLAAEVERRVENGGIETPPTEARRRRIERGHAVLAEELTVLDIHREESSLVIPVLAAQALVREEQGKAKSLSDAAGAAEKALAQSDVDHAKRRVTILTEPETRDDKYWAALVTLITIALLYNGRYGIIQSLSTVLVVLFTFVTIGNVVSLQAIPQWRISGEQIMRGLSGGLPETGKGLAMALATFGIIGVGATELLTYPYWCIEKGYARFTGWRSDDPAWAERARGWMRVMHWDAFLSMIIYTVATIAFYLMGAAVLFSEGRDPDGMRMVGTLASAYVPVFGEYAKFLFLLGAVAVLYSTFLVANAGHSRMFTDGLKVFGLMDRHSQRKHDKAISFFCVLLPLTCLAIFCSGINPVEAVAFAGMMQATMLPMIGFGALWFRWTATDPRLAPPRWWDALLVLSFVGLLVVGVYGVWSKLFR
jgi:Mn2+/Fe2+ NRAMP family transporter